MKPAGIAAVVLLLGVAPPANGQTGQDAKETSQRESTFDKIWKFAEWYENESNPVVQRVSFTGRYQHDFANVDADQGRHREWNVRRMRLGPRIVFLKSMLFHGEVELNPQEADPLYTRLTDFYVQWTHTSRLILTVGKQGTPFTADGSTSSKELIAIDRSHLTNNLWFTNEYFPGVSVSGRRAPWTYRAGIYSSGRANREFGEFSGGFFTLGVLGYDISRALGTREALVTGSYVYQQPDADNTFTRPFEHVASANLKLEADGWGLRADVSAGAGYLGQQDVWGAMAMPYLNATEKLQFVARYTFLESGGPNGIRLGAYENEVVSGRGDCYRELYVGANYYFYGHKLKLQSGVAWGDMQDRAEDGGAYSGVSWTTGLRVGW